MDGNTNLKQKVTCIANYAYEASEADELTLQPGDVVKDVERLGGGWWRGELRGRRGMFPDNFVSVIDQANVRSGGVQGRCRAVFSYQPANSDELSLAVGDVLDVLGEVEEGWWQGRCCQGEVGVFPSNFVVMLDPPTAAATFEPAPALPPKPVKELCRVLFPYTAVNDDELTLNEGDVVSIVSKEAPDKGWWRGELNGRVGLFPDNFVQLLPHSLVHEDEKRPERPSAKSVSPLYPSLNKYSEKITSVKELTTSKVSLHKENSSSKESSTHSSVTHSSKSETGRLFNNETVCDVDTQVKKPPVPTKKSPTPGSGVVGGLLSGLKNKMLSSSDKDKSVSHGGSNSSGEWDRPDGAASSRIGSGSSSGSGSAPAVSVVPTAPGDAATFDRVQRNSILNDPRAQRVKAPRRRPPSQALREDTLQQIGLSNGHEAENSNQPQQATMPSPDKPTEKGEEIKPRAREWEKHRAPWMEELKLNQAKKTPFSEVGKSKSVSSEVVAMAGSKGASGSTDRLLDVGVVEDKKATHSMEMSKSTSSISNRISVIETFEETKTRHSLDSKRESASIETEVSPAAVVSPTAAGRTFTTMLEEIKRPHAPPSVSQRTSSDFTHKQTSLRLDRITNSKHIDTSTGNTSEALHSLETVEKTSPGHSEKPLDRAVYGHNSVGDKTTSSIERRLHGKVADRADVNEALIAQLNDRITNLEKLVEVQAATYSAAIDDLSRKLAAETERRVAIQADMEKLAHCVTQV